MQLYEIYLVTNLINNKKYVGQTLMKIGYKKRLNDHLSEARNGNRSNSIFHKALIKYGMENFSVKRILKNIPENKIDYYEELWINKLNTYCSNNCGYNMTFGGQGVHGYKHTQESKLKMSQSSIDMWKRIRQNTELYKELCHKRSVAHKGKPKSDIHKKRLSEFAKKRFQNESGTFLGKHHSNQSKEKISQANGAKVAMIDIRTDNILATFNSAVKATNYLIEKGLTTNKYANSRILEICSGNGKTAYGYKWKFI